jgi:putative membrane protein
MRQFTTLVDSACLLSSCQRARNPRIFSTAENRLRHLINWLLSALAVWIVSRLVPGFHVTSIPAALIAALVIGLVNATLGVVIKIVTLPLTILTLGIFWFVVNALMLELASAMVPGFRIDAFASAFWGAIVLSLVNMLFRWLAGTGHRDD